MMGSHQKIYELGTNRRTKIKEKTAKEISGRIAQVVEEEWRELEKKNSLGIYRRFKKEMKEDDYSGSLQLFTVKLIQLKFKLIYIKFKLIQLKFKLIYIKFKSI